MSCWPGTDSICSSSPPAKSFTVIPRLPCVFCTHHSHLLDRTWHNVDGRNRNATSLSCCCHRILRVRRATNWKRKRKIAAGNLYADLCRCQFDNHNSTHLHQPIDVWGGPDIIHFTQLALMQIVSLLPSQVQCKVYCVRHYWTALSLQNCMYCSHELTCVSSNLRCR